MGKQHTRTQLRVLMLELNVNVLQLAGHTLPPTQTWTAPQTSAWANNTHTHTWGSWCWSWMLMHCKWQVTHSLPRRHELHLKLMHWQTTHTHLRVLMLELNVDALQLAGHTLPPTQTWTAPQTNAWANNTHTHTHLRVLMLELNVDALQMAGCTLPPTQTWITPQTYVRANSTHTHTHTHTRTWGSWCWRFLSVHRGGQPIHFFPGPLGLT